MIKTYKFKLYAAKRNKKLHRQINAAGLAYNHCIALHKRYWQLYHKLLNKFALQKHLTKLKKLERFSYLKEIGSQALQDVTDRQVLRKSASTSLIRSSKLAGSLMRGMAQST